MEETLNLKNIISTGGGRGGDVQPYSNRRYRWIRWRNGLFRWKCCGGSERVLQVKETPVELTQNQYPYAGSGGGGAGSGGRCWPFKCGTEVVGKTNSITLSSGAGPFYAAGGAGGVPVNFISVVRWKRNRRKWWKCKFTKRNFWFYKYRQRRWRRWSAICER